MKKFTLQASAALQALALLGAGAGAAFVAAPAVAQDLTSGGITGTVTDEAGAPVSGASVSLRSLAQGQVRNFTTNDTGTFTASGLAPGQYELTVNANGFSPSADTITIAQATSSAVVVSLVAPTGTEGDTIVVRGRARQVQTQGTTGQNIDVVKVNENLPIGRTITDITLLAPTTSRGVSGFATASGESVPSVGGGSVAENAYYVNGLNITNPDTYVGSARLPFYFYQNVDVQTGGYPAEFGRATGGVINATTKSGSNIPFAALHLDWEPSWLAAERQDRGDPDSLTEVGRFYQATTRQATLEAGGAVVPDHLFVYGLFQINRNKQENAYESAGVFERTVDRDPFWGVKVDGYITPTQHAEFTIFDTRNTQRIYDYSFDGETYDPNETPLEAIQESGGLGWVARYTGEVTPFLTLSAAYGKVKDRGTFAPADATAAYIQDYRSGSIETIGNPFLTTSLLDTKRRFYRGDADIRVSLAGQHQFRMGFDHEDLEELKTNQVVGNVPVIIRYRTDGVQYIYQLLGGNISAKNTSFYIQDSWTGLVDGLTLNLGLRNDRFRQTNLSGEEYLDLKNNWGPRLGFSYTPPSMDQWRFFGSYGRYFIPPAMNLGFRGKDLYYAQYFNYPGAADDFPIDPVTGMPLANVGSPMTNKGGAGYSSPCPPAELLSGAPGNPIGDGSNTCLILGAGVQDPAIAKLALDAKATYENEFILGTRYRMSSLLNVGLAATRRTLKRVSEDSDLHTNLYDYYDCDTVLETNDDGDYVDPDGANIDRCEFYSGNSTYYIINPGSDSYVVNDWYDALSGIATPITITGVPYSTPKRKYTALTFDWSRGDDGLWFGGGSLTWSKSIGSTEGTVKSDAGASAQDDAGSTQDFDYAGLADNNYGYLPNHRRWTFKAYGSIHATKQLLLGANVLLQSKMLGSCQSHHPTDPNAAGYGASSFFCPTGELDQFGNYSAVSASPRGTGVRSDWLKQVDVSARYNIPLGATDNRRLTLRADVFNVFNFKSVRQRYSTATQAKSTYGTTYNGEAVPVALQGTTYYEPAAVFNTPQSFQPPRYVRLGLDLLWGGAPALAPVVETPPPPPPPAPAPATQTCADGTVILATDACPVPPPPPAPAPERG